MEDWAEICRLHRSEQMPIRVIARRIRSVGAAVFLVPLTSGNARRSRRSRAA